MTLILSFISHPVAIQVSDRRLTLPDGSIHDEMANKAIVVECLDARFSAAYTGLAMIGTTRTDAWLAESLYNLSPHKNCAADVLNGLARHLTDRFRTLRNPAHGSPHSRLAVACAGFAYRPSRAQVQEFAPFIASISNFTDETGTYGPLLPEFRLITHTAPPGAVIRTFAFWRFDGAVPAMNRAIRRRLIKLSRTLIKSPLDCEAGAKSVVTLARAAASTPGAAGTVGREMMSVLIPARPKIGHEALYHPASATAFLYQPHQVGFASGALVSDLKHRREPDGSWEMSAWVKLGEMPRSDEPIILWRVPDPPAETDANGPSDRGEGGQPIL